MIQKFFSVSFIMVIPVFLFAHGGHGNGVVEGFTHPIFGADHLVAIVGTGILGYLLDSNKWYTTILTFIITMIVGGIFGIGNEATFFFEKIIAFSVFAIGLIIAFGYKPNLILIFGMLGAFGFFHGYAHGAEMSESNTALKYISGYSLGAFVAGLAGMLIARLVHSQNKKEKYINIVGGIICGCGIMMLLP